MFPIIDLHCDLLSYLARSHNHQPTDTEAIGCALPFLKEGGVAVQVLAIYTATESHSTHSALAQASHYRSLLNQSAAYIKELQTSDLTALSTSEIPEKTAVITALENASCFCEEDEPLKKGFERLEGLLRQIGPVLYISLTHHGENRFAGGNKTSVGLKADGLELLHFLNGRNIAIDFSHTSRALANDLLEALDKYQLDIPVLASHSNFDPVWPHNRNLTPEVAQEIAQRGGIIGINFLREFVDRENEDTLLKHIEYGLNIAAGKVLAFGADFFWTQGMNAPERAPWFFPAHADASKYPSILEQLMAAGHSTEKLQCLAFQNAANFLKARLQSA